MLNFRFGVLVILVLALLLFLPNVLAQEEPVPPAPPSENAILVIIGGLEDFLGDNATRIVMGGVAFLIVAVGRIVFPANDKNGAPFLPTERIYMIVVAAFGGLYILANVLGFQDWIRRGVEIGAVLSDVLKQILALLVVPSTLYAIAGRMLANPLVNRPQGDAWFSLDNDTIDVTPDFYNLMREALDDHERYGRERARSGTLGGTAFDPYLPHNTDWGSMPPDAEGGLG